MRIKRMFVEDVKQRQAERHHSVSLGLGQKYVIRELRQLYGKSDDEDKKARVNILEQVFRGSLPAAVLRDVNRLRRNNVTGDGLYSSLVDLYSQHGFRERSRDSQYSGDSRPTPTLICSEAM